MVRYSESSVFIAAIVCIFVFYSGLFSFPERNAFVSLLKRDQIQEICGEMKSSPSKTSSGRYYTGKLSAWECAATDGSRSGCRGLVTVFIPTEMAEAYFPGRLYSAAARRGAHLWDTGGCYRLHGQFFDGGFIITECTEGLFRDTPSGRLARARALCRLQFRRLMYAWGNAGGLLLALLCGAREYTDGTVTDAFRRAGLSHILALSGMHLSMFSGIAIFFGKRIGVKKLTFIIRLCALILFVWFAGFSPSLLRAFICSMLTLLAAVFSAGEPDMLIILAFSFLLQATISPSDLGNIGFILSYSALAGILIFQGLLKRLYIRWLPPYLAASLSSSTAAQTFTAPVSLMTFGAFSPAGIIATTVVSPFVTVFIYSGLLLIIICLIFPFAARPSGFFLNFLYTVIRQLVGFFAQIPQLHLRI